MILSLVFFHFSLHETSLWKGKKLKSSHVASLFWAAGIRRIKVGQDQPLHDHPPPQPTDGSAHGRNWEKAGRRDAISFQGLGAEMRRITEYPEPMKIIKVQLLAPAQDSPGSGLNLALPIGAANAVPDPQWCRRAQLGQIWSVPGSLSTPAVLPHVLSSFPNPTSPAQQPWPDPPHTAPCT